MDNKEYINRIKELMTSAGIDESYYEVSELEKKVYRFNNDDGSGRETRYTYDEDTDVLVKRNIDDSPAQCGGYIDKYVYYKKSWFNVGSISDRSDYAIYNNWVYKCEVDESLNGGYKVYLERATRDRNPQLKMAWCKDIDKGTYMRYVNVLDAPTLRAEFTKILQSGDYYIYIDEESKSIDSKLQKVINNSLEVKSGMRVKKNSEGEYNLTLDMQPEFDHCFNYGGGILVYTILGRVLVTNSTVDNVDVLKTNGFEKKDLFIPFTSGETPVEESDFKLYSKIFKE